MFILIRHMMILSQAVINICPMVKFIAHTATLSQLRSVSLFVCLSDSLLFAPLFC
jgi:hypothetical protein